LDDKLTARPINSKLQNFSCAMALGQSFFAMHTHLFWPF
jgi:hypothetical protein